MKWVKRKASKILIIIFIFIFFLTSISPTPIYAADGIKNQMTTSSTTTTNSPEGPYLYPTNTTDPPTKAEQIYSAPYTPSRMIPGNENPYTSDVSITNITNSTWKASDYVLSYHWATVDGQDVTTSGNRLETPLPQDILPGQTITVKDALIHTPVQSSNGNLREDFILKWDLLAKNGKWLSETETGVTTYDQPVVVEDSASDKLGLESFYQYAGKNTGGGSTAMVNLANGNTVFSYNPINNPGRGLATFVRLTYNSLDTSDSMAGYGWTLSASSIQRLGTSLDFQPKGQTYPTKVTLTDGDGTSHIFSLDKHNSSNTADWEYVEPTGVNLYLQLNDSSSTDKKWEMTRSDRTKFYFDADGYLTYIVDKNGNTLQLSYIECESNHKPTKFLTKIIDPAGRQTLTFDYYVKGEMVNGQALNNPNIIDKVQNIKDISGRTLHFTYDDQGQLIQFVDGMGSDLAKTFTFEYTTNTTNKNTKLKSVTDPRSNKTQFTYYDGTTSAQDKWKIQTMIDRMSGNTTFTYKDLDNPTNNDSQSLKAALTILPDMYDVERSGKKGIKIKNQKTICIFRFVNGKWKLLTSIPKYLEDMTLSDFEMIYAE